jgi:hypothetical protein
MSRETRFSYFLAEDIYRSFGIGNYCPQAVKGRLAGNARDPGGDTMSDYLEDRSPIPSKKPFDVWLERVSTIVKIGAIVVGGIWAYHHFGLFEEPELQHRARLDGRVEWKKPLNSDCIGWFIIKFENIGKRPIELTDLTFNVWHIEPSASTAPITYVDVVNADKLAPLVNATIVPKSKENEAIIETIYPPGVSDEVGLMVTVKGDAGKLLLFKATGKSRIEGEITKDWYTHSVGYACEEKDGR